MGPLRDDATDTGHTTRISRDHRDRRVAVGTGGADDGGRIPVAARQPCAGGDGIGPRVVWRPPAVCADRFGPAFRPRRGEYGPSPEALLAGRHRGEGQGTAGGWDPA